MFNNTMWNLTSYQNTHHSHSTSIIVMSRTCLGQLGMANCYWLASFQITVLLPKGRKGLPFVHEIMACQHLGSLKFCDLLTVSYS